MSINTKCFNSLKSSKIHGWSHVAQKLVHPCPEKCANQFPTIKLNFITNQNRQSYLSLKRYKWMIQNECCRDGSWFI